MNTPGRVVPFGTTTATARLVGGASVLLGWSLLETTGGATATATLYDGEQNNGQTVAAISLLAGQSTRDWLGVPGLLCERGLTLVVSSGSVSGAVWVVPGRVDGSVISLEGSYQLWSGEQ